MWEEEEEGSDSACLCLVDIVKFLEEYEKLPCLWKRSDPAFKDRIVRANAEHHLMETFNINDPVVLRKKIRSIRGTYNNEMRRIRASRRNGINEEKPYVPKLFWFKHAARFLQPLRDVDLEIDLDLTIEEPRKTTITTNKRLIKSKQTVFTKKKRFNFGNSSVVSAPVMQVKAEPISEEFFTHTTNEFAAFGNSVGLQLQKMPLELAIEVQSEIQALISNARLRSLRMKAVTFAEEGSPENFLSIVIPAHESQ